MTALKRFSTPQLRKLHSGKVRESFRIDAARRLIVVTDRISAFDRVLDTAIPRKGDVLNSLSDFWFSATREIQENHVVEAVDPCATVVREAQPVRIEVVVRGFITGSMWRQYAKGKRVFSGVELPEGLRQNQRLLAPVLTPTTKGEVDLEVSPREIVEQGLASQERWDEMAAAGLALFSAGTKLLEPKGLLLADTKYEFGTVDGRLVLIDELHTPDSSRLWLAQQHERDPLSIDSLDKEYVRAWLRKEAEKGPMPTSLPRHVVDETSRRYCELHRRVTGQELPEDGRSAGERLCANLVRRGLIRDGYVVVFMGSRADLDHARAIADYLRPYEVAVDLRVVSAHKNGERITDMAGEYNGSFEPGAAIAVAGLSNGLGGALAANLNVPVISCPPLKDPADVLLNIGSSLMMPGKVPAATVLRPDNAAQAALRCLNLLRLRERLSHEIEDTKRALLAADMELRG